MELTGLIHTRPLDFHDLVQIYQVRCSSLTLAKDADGGVDRLESTRYL